MPLILALGSQREEDIYKFKVTPVYNSEFKDIQGYIKSFSPKGKKKLKRPVKVFTCGFFGEKKKKQT